MKIYCVTPDRGHGVLIAPDMELETMQGFVEGYIEAVPMDLHPDLSKVRIICNEEGRLKDFKPSILIEHPLVEPLVGTVLICGTDGMDFTGLNDLQLQAASVWVEKHYIGKGSKWKEPKLGARPC